MSMPVELIWTVMTAALTCAISNSASCGIAIISEGQPHAVLIVEEPADDSITYAVEALQSYLFKSTGCKLPSSAAELAQGATPVELHIGRTPYAAGLSLLPEGIDPDGFVIDFPDSRHIVILGGSTRGTEYGVYDFLERYLGVRWLWPGEAGDHVPRHSRVVIPQHRVESQPAYISRMLSIEGVYDMNHPVGRWCRHHRYHWRIQHHHNLLNLFPPDIYAKTHPHFFPVVNGERLRPAAGSYDWEPLLDAEGIVGEAVKNIVGYFNDHPGAGSYSLGMNDTRDFGRPASRKNSVGLNDDSDYYFTFANQVAEGVLKVHPDKWFGCLAYNSLTDPPREAAVNPRIIPHICIDRMVWATPEQARRDRERTRRWHDAAPVLGWYDYIYGDGMYRVPRFYPHLMGQYIRFGYENGVRAYYAESYESTAWTEGPKLYVLMKLLWDPTLNVDALLGEWYQLAVGPQAAVPLQRYYAFWEDYWTRRVPRTPWYQDAKNGVYLPFDHPDYLDALTPQDLDYLDQLIAEVVLLAETPEQKQRAKLIEASYQTVRADCVRYLTLSKMRWPSDMPRQVVFQTDFGPPQASAPAQGEMPAGWSAWQNAGGRGSLLWDMNHGAAGRGSLAADAEGAIGSLVFYRYLPISLDEPSGSVYRLACRLWTTGATPTDQAGIIVEWKNAKGEWLPRKTTSERLVRVADIPDKKWVDVELFVMVPEGVDRPLNMVAKMVVWDARQGVFRFDDFEISRASLEDVIAAGGSVAPDLTRSKR